MRSYFLNAVDGIEKNDGILMVGSTNHLDRLDPGLAKRPSRFDRKYLFPNPNAEEREKYMVYWQTKLSDNHDLEFPDKLCPAVAKITNGFSFAYLQEAMVASLLAIARTRTGSARGCVWSAWKLMRKRRRGVCVIGTAGGRSRGFMIGCRWCEGRTRRIRIWIVMCCGGRLRSRLGF